MSSRLFEIPSRDSFATDTVWVKVVFDIKEVSHALRTEKIPSLVEGVLRERYGNHTMFAQIVWDVKTALLNALADKIEEGVCQQFVIVLNDSLINKAEGVWKKYYEMQHRRYYWVGESTPISES